MQIELFESNVVIFLDKYIKAIEDGYRLQNTNIGYVQDNINNGWLQAVLKKDEEYTAPFIQVGQYTIEEFDRQQFFKSVQEHVLNKAVFNLDSLFYDVKGVKMVKCVIRPTQSYTREELDALPWEEFKELAKKYDSFNRNRDVCTNMLVKMFEEV